MPGGPGRLQSCLGVLAGCSLAWGSWQAANPASSSGGRLGGRASSSAFNSVAVDCNGPSVPLGTDRDAEKGPTRPPDRLVVYGRHGKSANGLRGPNIRRHTYAMYAARVDQRVGARGSGSASSVIITKVSIRHFRPRSSRRCSDCGLSDARSTATPIPSLYYVWADIALGGGGWRGPLLALLCCCAVGGCWGLLCCLRRGLGLACGCLSSHRLSF